MESRLRQKISATVKGRASTLLRALLWTGSQETVFNPVGFCRQPLQDQPRKMESLLTTNLTVLA